MCRLESCLPTCCPQTKLAVILPLLFRRSMEDGWRLGRHNFRHLRERRWQHSVSKKEDVAGGQELDRTAADKTLILVLEFVCLRQAAAFKASGCSWDEVNISLGVSSSHSGGQLPVAPSCTSPSTGNLPSLPRCLLWLPTAVPQPPSHSTFQPHL